MLAAVIDGMNDGQRDGGAGAAGVRREPRRTGTRRTATARTSPPCSA